jgi:hypothetical protein
MRIPNNHEFCFAIGTAKDAVRISEIDAGSTLRALVFEDIFSPHISTPSNVTGAGRSPIPTKNGTG